MDNTNSIIAFAFTCAAQHIDLEYWHEGPQHTPPTKACDLGDGWRGLEQSFDHAFPETNDGDLNLFWRCFEWMADTLVAAGQSTWTVQKKI